MIIGVSGKIGSGKDEVGKIIQYLTHVNPNNDSTTYEQWNNMLNYNMCSWKIKKFADKLKDIVCLLLGCTREQLEDREFKEKELGEKWWCIGKPEIGMFIPYTEDNWAAHGDFEENLVMLTPRKLLQLLGTEAGRNIIHPNIWINALFSDYDNNYHATKFSVRQGINKPSYPNWVITDLRFPNEAESIKKRKGILIRLDRSNVGLACTGDFKDNMQTNLHPSETALDNYQYFNYNIDNTGTIEDLINSVKYVLQKEQII